jgi:hypothetical protein
MHEAQGCRSEGATETPESAFSDQAVRNYRSTSLRNGMAER